MPLYETTGDSETRLKYHVGYWPFVPPENADALDLLHKWQSEDPAYDREAWARVQTLDANADDAMRMIEPVCEHCKLLYEILERYADLWRRLADR